MWNHDVSGAFSQGEVGESAERQKPIREGVSLLEGKGLKLLNSRQAQIYVQSRLGRREFMDVSLDL